MKILLELSYKGSAYHGWQSQGNPGIKTVQGVLTAVCERLVGGKCLITGVSRTDAGVHALQYFCTLEADSITIPCASFPYAANSLLPEDITVLRASECDDDFHARYSCIAKEYVYLIHDGEHRDPFLSDRAWHRLYRLDEKKMNEAAEVFIGSHDFTSFCSAASDVGDKTRTVFSCSVKRRDDNLVELRIKANGFLYNMVRIITGTLVGVSEGKYEKDDIVKMIGSKNRCLAGMTAPACGLYLNRVFY